jgi:hypothetical protein
MIIKVRTRIDITHDRPGYDPKRGPITVDLCVEGGEPQRFTEAKRTQEDCKGWLPRDQRRNR